MMGRKVVLVCGLLCWFAGGCEESQRVSRDKREISPRLAKTMEYYEMEGEGPEFEVFEMEFPDSPERRQIEEALREGRSNEVKMEVEFEAVYGERLRDWRQGQRGNGKQWP